jgi:hypothetical protein
MTQHNKVYTVHETDRDGDLGGICLVTADRERAIAVAMQRAEDDDITETWVQSWLLDSEQLFGSVLEFSSEAES